MSLLDLTRKKIVTSSASTSNLAQVKSASRGCTATHASGDDISLPELEHRHSRTRLPVNQLPYEKALSARN
jgi:hypothetical protein